jgi:hypothetical protein
MSVNKKRMIPVLSVFLVTLMALMAVAPAFAAAGTKDQYLTPSRSESVAEPRPVFVIDPTPKALLHVAKIGVQDLPWYDSRYRYIAIHVVIVDDNGRAVGGAEVTGHLEVLSFDNAPLVGRTDANGDAVLKTFIPRDSKAEFCVVDVVKDGYEYDAKGNEQTCVVIYPR